MSNDLHSAFEKVLKVFSFLYMGEYIINYSFGDWIIVRLIL